MGITNKDVLKTVLKVPQLEEQLDSIVINPTQFGLNESATWQTNRNAIQQANDLVSSRGGGIVLIPNGTFLVKGVWQDDNVEIKGNGGAILKHPDGIGEDIIRSRVKETTCNTITGNKTITVASSNGIYSGCIVAIRGVGGIQDSQRTRIVNPITSTDTNITLTSVDGFLSNGILIIGSEIISYTTLTGNVIGGITRGLYGTLATNYNANTEIGLVARLYTEVVNVDGNNITLLDMPTISLNNVEITIGVINPKLKNIKLDGNRLQGGAPSEVHPLKWELTRYGLIEDVTVTNGEAGFMIRHGNRDLKIIRPIFVDCSVIEKTFGSGGWLFRANKRCVYKDVTAIGKMWTGIYFDDRTSKGSEWDGENEDCTLDGFNMCLDRLSDNLGVANVGGRRITIQNGKISGCRTGLSTTSNSQGVGYTTKSSDCTLQNIDLYNIYQPAIIKAERTKVINVVYDNDTTANKQFVDSSGDTLYVNSGNNTNIKSYFIDGTYLNPAISFGNDKTTGFYRINDGQVQYVSQAELVMRLIKTGLMFAEGKDILTGGTTGTRFATSPNQKIGFWGNTPITRPNGCPPACNDLNTTMTLLNYIRSKLYEMGLIDIQ